MASTMNATTTQAPPSPPPDFSSIAQSNPPQRARDMPAVIATFSFLGLMILLTSTAIVVHNRKRIFGKLRRKSISSSSSPIGWDRPGSPAVGSDAAVASSAGGVDPLYVASPQSAFIPSSRISSTKSSPKSRFFENLELGHGHHKLMPSFGSRLDFGTFALPPRHSSLHPSRAREDSEMSFGPGLEKDMFARRMNSLAPTMEEPPRSPTPLLAPPMMTRRSSSPRFLNPRMVDAVRDYASRTVAMARARFTPSPSPHLEEDEVGLAI